MSMKLHEIYSHAPGMEYYRPTIRPIAARFSELGINEAFPFFETWLHHGAFELPQEKLMMFEQAFHLINSILPDEILDSYNHLPMMYRGMVVNHLAISKFKRGGIPIQSRVMAWTPSLAWVRRFYIARWDSWVILGHQPKASEVIISMNQETMEFLNVENTVNPGETILSLPILKITPDMVVDTNL
jgi:hypothetical protein